MYYPPIKNLKSRKIFHLLLVEVLFNYRSFILNDVEISKIIFRAIVKAIVNWNIMRFRYFWKHILSLTAFKDFLNCLFLILHESFFYIWLWFILCIFLMSLKLWFGLGLGLWLNCFCFYFCLFSFQKFSI